MEIKDHMPHAYAHRLGQAIDRYLKKRYGASRVMLLGSVAAGCYNPDFSDIDVYFEGVGEELVADAMEDCKRNFGLYDSGGRRRVDYITASQLPWKSKRQILNTAEEI